MDDSDTDYMTYGRRTQRFVLEGKHIRKHKDGIENFNDYFSDTDEDSSSDESRHLNDEGRQKQNRQLTTRNASAQHIEDSTDSSADIDEYTALNVENNLNFAVSPKQRRKFTTQELEDRATVLKENKSANIKIIRKKCRVLDSESESSDHYQDDVSPFSDSEDESEPLMGNKSSGVKNNHTQNGQLTARNASCEHYQDDLHEEDTGLKRDKTANVKLHNKQSGISTSKCASNRDILEISNSKSEGEKNKSISRHLMNSTRIPLKSKDLQEVQIFDNLLISPIIPRTPGKTNQMRHRKISQNMSQNEVLDKKGIASENKLSKRVSSAKKINSGSRSFVDLQDDGNDAGLSGTTVSRLKNSIRLQQETAYSETINESDSEFSHILTRSSTRKQENPNKDREKTDETGKSENKRVPFRKKDIPIETDVSSAQLLNESPSKVRAKTLKSPAKKVLNTNAKAKENILNGEKVVEHRELLNGYSENDVSQKELHSKKLRKIHSQVSATSTETTSKMNSIAKENLLNDENVVQHHELSHNTKSRKVDSKILTSPSKTVLKTNSKQTDVPKTLKSRSKAPISSKTKLHISRQNVPNESILIEPFETNSDLEDEISARKNDVSKTLKNWSKEPNLPGTKLHISRQDVSNKSVLLDQHESSTDTEDEMPSLPTARKSDVSKTLKTRSEAPTLPRTKLNISRQNMSNKRVVLDQHETGTDIENGMPALPTAHKNNQSPLKKTSLKKRPSKTTSKSLKSKRQPECFHRSSETTAVFSAETPSDNNDGRVASSAKRRKDENNEISALPTAHKNDQSPFKKTSMKKKPSKTTSKSLKSKKPERLHRNSEITAVFSMETSDDDDALVESPAKKRKDENNEISARPTAHQNAQSPLKKRSLKKKPPKTTSKSLKSKSQAELPHRNSETTAVFSAGTCDDDEAYVAIPAKKRKNETPNEAIIKNSRVVLKDILEKSPQKGRIPANKSSVKSFTPHNKVGKEKGRTKKQVKNQETTNANELRRSKRTRRSPLKSWCNERVRYRYNLNGEITFVDIVKYEPEKKPERRKPKNKTKISKLPEQPKSLTVFDGSTGGLVSAQVFQPEGSTEWLCTDEHTPETAPYLITRIFQSENISFGFLKVKRLQKKPSQQLPHSDACFMVFKGQVKVKIHKSVFCAQPCDSFIVPCGNAYSVENISNTSALLSFCIYTGSILSDLVV